MFWLLVALFLALSPLCATLNTDHQSYEIYGNMLVANDKMAVSGIDRTQPIFNVFSTSVANQSCLVNLQSYFNNDSYIMKLAVPSKGSSGSTQHFFILGALYDSNGPLDKFIGQVDISFPMACTYSFTQYPIPGSVAHDYSVFGVNPKDHLLFYSDGAATIALSYRNNSLINIVQPIWLHDGNFTPFVMDISQGSWGVIAGELASSGVFTPTLYLIALSPSSATNYTIVDSWQVPFPYQWQSRKSRLVSDDEVVPAFYWSSVAVNSRGDILFGVPSINTVFHLNVNLSSPQALALIGSRIHSTTYPSLGYGKSVAWFDNETAVILANNLTVTYAQWQSSRVEIFDLSQRRILDDDQPRFSYFPSAQQPIPPTLSARLLIMVVSVTGSLILMDYEGMVYIMYPASIGYYSMTNVANVHQPMAYFGSIEPCSRGRSKMGHAIGKFIFDGCAMCREDTFTDTLASNSCQPCNITDFYCSLGSIAQVPLFYLEKVSQATSFPRSSDQTVFDDILLTNMFNIPLDRKCLIKSPMFWTLLVVGGVIIFSIVMTIIRLSGKYADTQEKIQIVFQHFDLIHGGERWISGAISLSIMVLIIFAALFTNSFINQYPDSSSKAPDYTCDESLRNSQFFSSMKTIENKIYENSENVFALLEKQTMTIRVTLLSTISQRTVQVTQKLGSISISLSANVSNPLPGLMDISCDLISKITTVIFNISEYEGIGGIRISLEGPRFMSGKIEIKEMKFSQSFTMRNRLVAIEPDFTLELIPLVNETRAIGTDEVSQYNAIWLPVIKKDDSRNFVREEAYESDSTTRFRLLSIELTRSTYYISNIEKPIIKSTRAIFRNILFASTCMELVGFAFLLFKLVVLPIGRSIIAKICPGTNKKEEDDDDEQNEDVEEQESEEETVIEIFSPRTPVNQW